MMTCPRCHAQYGVIQNFCGRCGNRLGCCCSVCGEVNAGEDLCCRRCGHPLRRKKSSDSEPQPDEQQLATAYSDTLFRDAERDKQAFADASKHIDQDAIRAIFEKGEPTA